MAEQEFTRAQTLREEAQIMRNEAMRPLAGATMSPQEASLGLPSGLSAFPQRPRQEPSAPIAPRIVEMPAEKPAAPVPFAGEPVSLTPPANEVVIPADVPSQAPLSQGAPRQEDDPMDLRARFECLLASSSTGRTEPPAPQRPPLTSKSSSHHHLNTWLRRVRGFPTRTAASLAEPNGECVACRPGAASRKLQWPGSLP